MLRIPLIANSAQFMALRSSLYQTHKSASAQFSEYHGWELPIRFSSLKEEYRTAVESVALFDRSYVGRLRMTGEEGLDLLDRLSTNNLAQLAKGSGSSTVLTTPKGRIVDWLTIYSHGGNEYTLLTSPQNHEKVMKWFEAYTFGEEYSLEDVTQETTLLLVIGPKSSELLNKVTGRRVEDMGFYHGVAVSVNGVNAYVAREDGAWGTAYNLFVSASGAAKVWDFLLKHGGAFGIAPMGTEAFEALRVKLGVPEYGKELGEEHNPLEAGLRLFISFDKGCYTGQEVVARLNTYQKVKQFLVKLKFTDGESPGAGRSLQKDGKEAGVITSVVWVPGGDAHIALGYVKKAHAQRQNRLELKGGSNATVEVVEVLGG